MTPQQALELAVRLSQAGKWAQAESLFRQIVATNPSEAQSHYNLGRFLASRSDMAGAIQCYEQSLRLNPNFPEALSNLGELWRLSGKLDDAIGLLQQAVTLRPNFSEAQFNLALALADQNHLDQAIAHAREAAKMLRQSWQVHNLLGNLLRENDRADEAIAEYRRALELRPDYAEARWHLALALLLKGEFQEGWQAYEARRQVASVWREPGFSQPLWDGSDLAGRRILLWAEQGFGDTIQFIRYASLVKDRRGQVLLLCQPELRRLLHDQPGIDQVMSVGDVLPQFDVHCPLISLPRIFNPQIETIPARVPYLKADSSLSAQWKLRMKPDRKNVGLVWATQPAVPSADKRSIGLDQMAALANVPGVTFWSLQKGAASAEADSPPAGMDVIDCSTDLHDFADSAALIANLDLVIACDTAVAHLAGALGVPTWIILPRPSPWRWMQDRADSPWYPTVRLFRQQRPGDWADPVAQVVEELRRLPPRDMNA